MGKAHRRERSSSFAGVYRKGLRARLGEAIPIPIEDGAGNFNIRFCEKVVGAAPKNIDALAFLGNAYTEAGEYRKGLEIDKRLALLRPGDSVVFYNLACSYALLGQREEAFAALGRAVELGYRDVEHMRRDPDLESLRTDKRFEAVLEGATSREMEPKR